MQIRWCMKLPIKFYSKDDFSISIECLNQNQVTGYLEIDKPQIHCAYSTYSISGLVYQLNKDIYQFTFSINWENSNSSPHTTFTGLLTLEENTMNCILELNWLLVKDLNGINKSSNGYSKLTRKRKAIINRSMPFPINASINMTY
jgi:hypothetical protein